jgi:tRNA-splicing endonuclease subunit Sen54
MKQSGATSAVQAVIIPKRGEKDFEPTGFGGQAKLLERSRQAMYQAVSGERTVGSRSLVKATWVPSTQTAVLHSLQGKIFETVGIINRSTSVRMDDNGNPKSVTTTRNELLPEEALFLIERGNLQVYSLPVNAEGTSETIEGWDGQLDTNRQAPMSLQQAMTVMMNKKGLTRQKYLIYAYLKRLGYVVQRASVVDTIRSAPTLPSSISKKAKRTDDLDAEGIIADPQRPIRLVKIWDLLFYIPRRLAQVMSDAACLLASYIHNLSARLRAALTKMITSLAQRTIARGRPSTGFAGVGVGLSASSCGLLGSQKWDSYESLFSSLQIVPFGHDFFLPRTATSSSPAANKGSNATSSIMGTASGPKSEQNEALKPFYYAWRPATAYRKSHPPPPEFRIVVVDAQSQPLLNLWQFQDLFASVPIPGSEEELFGTFDLSTTSIEADNSKAGAETGVMDQDKRQQRLQYERDIKAKNDAKNRAAYGRFSEGKQKFLAERAQARREEKVLRQVVRDSQLPRWRQFFNLFWRSWFGMRLRKLLLLDFALVRMMARLFSHAPPGCFVPSHTTTKNKFGAKKNAQPYKTMNVFPPLKAGRRSVVLAIVDGSITTLLRFGESEFAKYKLSGSPVVPTVA